MLESRSYYRTTLYLSIVNALINTLVWNHLVFYSQYDPLLSSSHSLIFYVIFLAIPFGLWLGSPVALFLGAIWLLLWAGVLLWPLISSGIAPLISWQKFLTMLASFYVFSAALSLLIAGILFSKKFATEFAYERKHLPRYKTFLKWLFGGVAILAMIIASFKDILHAAH